MLRPLWVSGSEQKKLKEAEMLKRIQQNLELVLSGLLICSRKI